MECIYCGRHIHDGVTCYLSNSLSRESSSFMPSLTFALSRCVAKSEDGDNNAKPISCTTVRLFRSSLRSFDDRLMVICQDELKCVSVVGARRRISALEEDGEWPGALGPCIGPL
jgi:hypothetical protein